jgi:hypothetical protein
MKQLFFNVIKVALLGVAFSAMPALSQTYESQKALDEEFRSTAAELSFLQFDSESSWGQTRRCQLQYRVVSEDNPYKSGDAQIVQGSITSDYYQGKPINFVLNLQPLRLDVNPSSHQASSKTINPKTAVLTINGLSFAKYQLETLECDGSSCVVYAPKTGPEILEIIKVVNLNPIFDAEIAYSLDKGTPDRNFKLSNLTVHGSTNSEVRKQFSSCLKELMKKQITDIQKLDSTVK